MGQRVGPLLLSAGFAYIRGVVLLNLALRLTPAHVLPVWTPSGMLQPHLRWALYMCGVYVLATIVLRFPYRREAFFVSAKKRTNIREALELKYPSPFLDRARTLTDEPADRLVAAMAKHPNSPDALEYIAAAAARGRGKAPPGEGEEGGGRTEVEAAAMAFLAQVEAVPAWLSFEAMEAGRRVLRRHLLLALTSGYGALVESYAYGDGAKVLSQTGRLRYSRDVGKRLYETAQFYVDVVLQGLRKGSAGYSSAIRVRLLHARVRRYIHTSTHVKWDSLSWGEPACQEDMAHTVCLFSHCYIRGMELLGVPLTPAEKESIHHLWRYAGYLLGTIEPLLARTYEEEKILYESLVQHSRVPDEGSIALTRSTIEGLAWQPITYPPTALLTTEARLFCGDELADQLKLPPPSWGYLLVLRLVALVTLALSAAVDIFPPFSYALEWSNQLFVVGALHAVLKGRTSFGFSTSAKSKRASS